MKLFGAVFISLGLAFSVQGAEPTIIDKGPHHRTFEKVVERTLPDGTVTTEKERYVELATGLHYFKDNEWVESKEEIEIINGSAVARQGPHQVIWNANANSPGAVDLLAPDGKRFQTHVLGVAYTDRASGRSFMIADIKDSVGVVVGANQVIYPDAFDGLRASIRYTYTRAGLEQDILLEEAPRPPQEYDAALDPATTRLELYTEFIEPPAPTIKVQTREQEADVQRRQAMAFPDVTDDSLDFGGMHVGSGHAFLTADEQVRTIVQKEWVQLEGRQFLIESVELPQITPLLDTLPVTAALKPEERAARMAKAGTRRNGNGQVVRVFPHAPAKRVSSGTMTLAAASPVKRALVVDYTTLNSSLTNYTFMCVETYLISGAVNLYGSNVVEGGTVIKYTPNASAKIDVKGTLWFDTDLYRPVVFTARTDGTMGQSIASGTLAGADIALRFDYNTSGQLASVTNVKVLYANKAFEFAGGVGHEVRHAQLVNCGTAARVDGGQVWMRNIMGWNLTNALTGAAANTSTGRWEHATFDQVTNLVTTATAAFTNCLLTTVISTNGLAGANNTVLTSSNGVYKAVGNGFHYLADSSAYRDIGTTNINSGLLSELRLRTTYAPVALSDISIDTTLYAQATREVGIPDAGFYYPPLDWFATNVLVGSNVTVVVTNGAAIGIDYSGGSWGIRLKSANFHSVGSATAFNRVVRSHMAQEKSGGNPGTRACFYDAETVGSSTAELRLRFTEFTQLASDGYMYYVGTKSRALEFTHGRFYNNWLALSVSAASGPIVCGFTNSLWERPTVDITRSGSASTNIEVHFRNNLFRTRGLYLRSGHNTSWTVKDNLFDRMDEVTDTGSAVSNAYNAYFQITLGYSLSGGANNLALTNLSYQAGTFGPYYQPTNSLLVNAGSRTADLASLYHWTVLTNSVKETNSTVDIGIHYVAASGGAPIDTDSDGIPDYLEDLNGNGSVDSGETDWQSYNSPNGLTGSPGLQVFTPLK